MLVNTKKMVSITEANQNFSRIAKMVDESKSVVILKNNKPKYVVIEFNEFAMEAKTEEEKINEIADKVLTENFQAFKELAR